MLFVCLLFIQISYVSSMSIVNKTSTSAVKSHEERIQNLENTVAELKSLVHLPNTTQPAGLAEKEPILFYAVTTKTLNLERKSTVVFDQAQINYGGHYNEYDGVFVSPVTGVYLFSWTVCTTAANYAFTELVVENTIISVAGEYESHGHYDCGSMTAVCKVNKNDHAWIRTTDYTHNSKLHHLLKDVSVGTNSFMGILIHRE